MIRREHADNRKHTPQHAPKMQRVNSHTGEHPRSHTKTSRRILKAVAMIGMSLFTLVALHATAVAGPRIIESTPVETGDAQASDTDGAVDVTVVVAEAKPKAKRQRKKRSREDWFITGFEVGARFVLETVTEDWFSGGDEGTMGGLGLNIRYRFAPKFALQFGVSGGGRGDEEGFEETRTSFDVGPLFYLGRPHGFMQVFFTTSMVGHHSEIMSRGEDVGSYAELGPFIGVGTDFYFGDLRVSLQSRAEYLMRDEFESSGPDYQRDYYITAESERAAFTTMVTTGWSF